MQWFLYAVAAWLTFGGLSTISTVGKPRQPVSSGTATVTVVITAVIVTGLVLAALRVAHA